jgi:hypothetical protein
VKDVIYDGPYTAVVTPDGTVFEKGKPVKVKDAVAEDLIRQGFKPSKSDEGNK